MSATTMADEKLRPPNPIGLQSNRDSVATTATTPSIKAHDSASIVGTPIPELTRGSHAPGKPKSRRKIYVLGALGVLAVVVVAVVVPVYFKVIKSDKHASTSTGTSGGNPSGSPGGGSNPTSGAVTSGGDGSIITKDDGSTFTYSNKFGGYWVFDPTNPFNNSAQAQSWTPPLNQPWKYGTDLIRGVNLGGWLVLEPFISPALFEPYQPTNPAFSGIRAVDEWTLCQAIAANSSSGGVAQVIENHYATFITEQDFADIAGAGLNWVRLPIPYWAVEKFEDEPFLEGVAWKYFLKAVEWARKYGLRINLDLHTIPGSQSGFNHSGKLGSINWLQGVMGIANAQRSLNILRTITEFIAQDQYKDVVVMFGVVNEAKVKDIGMDAITSFYLEMHDMMRNITGLGKGPFISIHNGFNQFETWNGFLPGADRVALDGHPYFSFARLQNAPLSEQVNRPCGEWGAEYNGTMNTFGFVTAGEWSLGFTDCAYYLNGANAGYRWDGTLPGYTGPTIGDCKPWLDSTNWSADLKADLKQLALAHMDATQNHFFWTWRIGASDRTGKVNAPLWSYSLGLKGGWIPTDPRAHVGVCQNAHPRTGPLKPTQTAYVAQTIPASVRSAHPFPPAALRGQADAAALPTYTPTGTPRTMPGPTYTAATVPIGSGWVGASGGWDGDYVPVEGCTYPDTWNAADAAVPPRCTGRRRVVRAPRMTGLPAL